MILLRLVLACAVLASQASGFVQPLQLSKELHPGRFHQSQPAFAIFKRHHSSPAPAPAAAAPKASKEGVSPPPKTSAVTSLVEWGKVLWQFGRPHTMIGTAAAAMTVPWLAASTESRNSGDMGLTILQGMVPGLLTNVFITGVNQIADVEIDKVNKPHLPVAAGKLSVKSAAAISGAALMAALAMVFRKSPYTSTPLKLTVVLPALLGALYSLPPFRLKKHPLLAMLAILAVRGPIVNMGYYAHTKAVTEGYKATSVSKFLKDHPSATPLTAYFTLFAAIIALTKDIPDIKGDKMHNILSYSVKLGPQKVFEGTATAMTTLLSVVATALIGSTNLAAPMTGGEQIRRLGLGVLAALTASDINARRHRVDPENPTQVRDFYMNLWRLFQASYTLLPLINTA